jgi:hypothetical protein
MDCIENVIRGFAVGLFFYACAAAAGILDG